MISLSELAQAQSQIPVSYKIGGSLVLMIIFFILLKLIEGND
jgi:hypothetical protein